MVVSRVPLSFGLSQEGSDSFPAPTRNLQQGERLDELGRLSAGIQSHNPSRLASSSRYLGPETSSIRHRNGRSRWSGTDSDDLDRLGHMLSGYLGTRPFSEGVSFQKLVKGPLLSIQGPLFHAVQRLRDVLSKVTVKHLYVEYCFIDMTAAERRSLSPGNIDTEVILPSITITPRKLRFGSMQRITYNAMVATDVLGANWGEFSGRRRGSYWEGYHYSTRSDLDLAMIGSTENLTFEAEDLLPTCGPGDLSHRSPALQIRLQTAIGHLQAAVIYPGWKEWHSRRLFTPPYVTATLPDAIKDSWIAPKQTVI